MEVHIAPPLPRMDWTSLNGGKGICNLMEVVVDMLNRLTCPNSIEVSGETVFVAGFAT